MSTQSTPANNSKQYLGTPRDTLIGYMSIKMRTNLYYTDGTLLQTGTTNTVTRDWGMRAVENAQAEDLGGVDPVMNRPNGLTKYQAQAVRSAITPALPKLANAMQAYYAGTADVRIACLGDSTTGGAYGSGTAWDNCRVFSPPWLLGGLLSDTFDISQDSAFGTAGATGTIQNYDPRITVSTANWTVTGLAALCGNCYRNDTTEFSTLSFKFAEPFDTIRVGYITVPATGNTFGIGVDGGPQIGASINTVAGALGILEVTRSCPLGTHTVDINKSATGAVLAIAYVDVSDSTKRRVKIYNWGSGGQSSVGWTSVATTYGRFQQILLLAPHLVYIDLGINDAIAGTVVGTFTTNMQALITQCRLAGADVIIGITTPVAASIATLATQNGLYLPLRALAQQNGCPIVDYFALMGDQPAGVAAGYFLPANDNTHPGTTGYQAKAQLMASVLGLSGIV